MLHKSGILPTAVKRVVVVNIVSVAVISVLLGLGPLRLNVVTHTHFVIELLCSYLLIANLFLYASSEDVEITPYKAKTLRLKVWNVIVAVGLLVLTACIGHVVLVLFGAPFTQSVSETFHLACLLTSTTVLPCMCIIGPSSMSWFHAWSTQTGHERLHERNVVICSLASVVGAWIGAFPIPLDWDRPWQAWPITCVLGSLMCYCCSLLVTSLLLIRQTRLSNKSKAT